MATAKELEKNLKREMDHALREQDALELRSQLNAIHNSLHEAIRNPKRIPRYRKVL